MKVITYFPTTVEAKDDLSKRVAVVHARAVVDYVKNLPVSSELQGKLLKELSDVK